VGEAPAKGKVKTSPLRANGTVTNIARCCDDELKRRQWAAVFRLSAAVFARSRRLNLHAHTR
jgi:hypothetical protein